METGNVATRKYPQLPPPRHPPSKPISFVVVRFSDDYLHNILQSTCVNHSFNELITIENTGNLYFDHLTESMAAGIAQARHDLIAVVHEDVVLPDGWQSWFELSLEALEMHDPNWGVLGAVGWTDDNEKVGHWSDPHRYVNLFSGEKFHPVLQLDEQLLLFHRARLIELDHDLPGIHHIGRDIPLLARQRGMKAYAIDAPTIHKYADQHGNIIATKEDSPKIADRGTLTYQADLACCNEYIVKKWPQLKIQDYTPPQITLPDMDDAMLHKLDTPIILLARGGGGSRLLSTVCQDLGMFLGNALNETGDSLEVVRPIYQGIIEKYRCTASWQKQHIVPRLRTAAATMLKQRTQPIELWGFKLPESILLLPEICTAFPRARFIHMVRDPVTTCHRRTHMTARLDNHIGRISLPLAYDDIGRPRKKILEDSPALHMAYTTMHQLNIVAEQLADVSVHHHLLIRFEDLIDQPTACVEQVRSWLGVTRKHVTVEEVIDSQRIQRPAMVYAPDIQRKVEHILHAIRMDYGYILC